ncbi:MAG: hypothetical protein KF757_10730 [Phycisphaeraceae bacterium]|nr:hypothetical protein [Phycisphaeraceae bacterium]MCW5764232.1 hypothetical protein [Phycisphaeraceae bacterium]
MRSRLLCHSDQYPSVPPPPGVGGGAGVIKARPGRPKGAAFSAELDLAEFDERGRVKSVWTARAALLSRSNIVIRSRRMIYPESTIGIMIHLIDSKPVVLLARVVLCDYDCDGLYFVDLDLIPLPTEGPVAKWAASASA